MGNSEGGVGQGTPAVRPLRAPCGKAPGKFYVMLRRHLEEIIATEALRGKVSDRTIWEGMGLSQGMFRRLRAFIQTHREELNKAFAANEWTAIEARLFGRFGNYQGIPTYKAALDEIHNGPRKIPVTPAPKKRGRPPGSKTKVREEMKAPVPAETSQDPMDRIVRLAPNTPSMNPEGQGSSAPTAEPAPAAAVPAAPASSAAPVTPPTTPPTTAGAKPGRVWGKEQTSMQELQEMLALNLPKT